MKKVKWQDVYEIANHNKYSQITEILRTYEIKSNIKNLLINYAKTLIIIIVILLAILIYAFIDTPIIILYAFLLIIGMLLLSIVYSTYTMSIKEDKIVTKINFEEIIIPYDKLINIYMSQEKKRMLFCPVYYYNIKIMYLLNEEKVNILSFPVIMLDKKETLKFFKSFQVKYLKNEEMENKKKSMEKKNFYKSLGIVISILTIILLIISVIIYIIK